MDTCIFDSKLTQYKDPFGALPSGQSVTFHVYLPKRIAAERVDLVIHTDDSPDVDVPMELVRFTADENVYQCVFCPARPKLYFYNFRFVDNGEQHTLTPDDYKCAEIDGSGSSWQLTVYDKDTKTPSCLGDGILYQIFPDRFYNSGIPKMGVPTDRDLRDDWGELPVYRENSKGVFTCNDYFGGDLKGIEKKLDYLEELGVSCIYLNPIFEAHANHRYNVADYMKIDPLLGTEQDFTDLCEAAKKRGMSVIIDGVFNHTGSDSIYFNKEGRYGENTGAYRDPNSPYYPWYQFKNYPDDYESWWGFKTLPNVNEDNKEFLDFICRDEDSVIHHWMKAGASGFRLDVADELPDIILDEINRAIKSHGDDKVIIGEVWEDATNKIAYSRRRRYLLGGQLDSVMNYPFRSCVLDYVRDGKGRQFLTTVNSIVENYPLPALNCAMNPLSTHDTERALTVLACEPSNGRDRIWQADNHYLHADAYWQGINSLKLAATLQYFLPGIPSLYYGDEAGLSGYRDPFNRCCYPWGYENAELVEWFKKLGQLRKQAKFLKDCQFTPLCVNDNICSYIRHLDEEHQLLVAINRSYESHYLPTPKAFKNVRPVTLCGSYNDNGQLEQHSAVVFLINKDAEKASVKVAEPPKTAPVKDKKSEK